MGIKKKTKHFRLLAVDPSSSMRAVLGHLGDDSGIRVDLCTSLAEARECISLNAYQLVLSATELPDGSYLDVLASVRGVESLASVPILLLSATRSENVVQDALDKGITEVFFKRDLNDLARYLENFAYDTPVRGKEAESPRALVVEDDRFQATFYRAMLEHLGFVVTYVPSGEAAIKDAERQIYDLILVDIVLSGVCSGLQFLRRLRDPAVASSTAVAIAMSAYVDEARRLEALRAGANVFLPKPIKEHELAALVKGMSSRPGGGLQTTGKKKDAPPPETACDRCQPCQLTLRESNICALVAAGYSDKRIAEEMGVSYWTVRTHIAHAFKKCQVSNRVELVRRLQGK